MACASASSSLALKHGCRALQPKTAASTTRPLPLYCLFCHCHARPGMLQLDILPPSTDRHSTRSQHRPTAHTRTGTANKPNTAAAGDPACLPLSVKHACHSLLLSLAPVSHRSPNTPPQCTGHKVRLTTAAIPVDAVLHRLLCARRARLMQRRAPPTPQAPATNLHLWHEGHCQRVEPCEAAGLRLCRAR